MACSWAAIWGRSVQLSVPEHPLVDMEVAHQFQAACRRQLSHGSVGISGFSNKKICLTMLTLPMKKKETWDSPHNFNTVSVGCRPSFYHGWAMPTWLEVHLQAPKIAILPASQVAQWDFNSIPTNKSVHGIMASNQTTCRAQAWAADSLTLAMEIRQDHHINFWITATQNNHH